MKPGDFDKCEINHCLQYTQNRLKDFDIRITHQMQLDDIELKHIKMHNFTFITFS